MLTRVYCAMYDDAAMPFHDARDAACVTRAVMSVMFSFTAPCLLRAVMSCCAKGVYYFAARDAAARCARARRDGAP